MNPGGAPHPSQAAGAVLVYRYGWLAWLWRSLILFGLGAGALLIVLGVRTSSLALSLIAVPLVLPSLFFGCVVATGVVRLPDGSLRVSTLLIPRRVPERSYLGRPTVRIWAYSRGGRFYAPRAWVPVRGRLPIYLDLLARIPDRRAFANLFGINRNDVPRSSSRGS